MPPRPRYPMPDYLREALESRGLFEAYPPACPALSVGSTLPAERLHRLDHACQAS
jgi:hypothetical protein